MNSEYDFEPVKGLPAELPRGEHVLWQGSPDWRSLARRGFHVRKFGFYFGLLIAWQAIEGAARGDPATGILLGCSWLLLLGAVVVGLLTALARLTAQNTVYTVTNRRIVMRHGIALPMSVNIPFTIVDSASMRAYPDGTGEISVALLQGQRLGYLLTWPHVRPWRFSRPEAMLRTVPEVARVSAILIEALRDALPGTVATPAAPPLSAAAHSLAA